MAHHFGLDIGSYSLKFVLAEGKDDSAKIKFAGSVYNPVGQVLPTDNNQLNQLAEAVKTGIRDFGLHGLDCHLSLPSQHAYTSIVSMPNLSDSELSSAIRWEAEQHIPVSLDEVNFEYDVIYRPARGDADQTMSVFMVGTPKKVVDRFIELVDLVGVEPIALEPESLSMYRAYFADKVADQQVTTMICNFGALTTSFVVVDKGYIVAVHNANIGSLALTRVIEKGLSLDPSNSEEYKRTYGLDPSQLEGKVREAMLPTFEALVREIRKTIQFYISQSPSTNMISRVIMCGGGSNLPAIAPYLVEALSIEVLVGNPFTRFSVDQKMQLPEDVTAMSVATGLAVKGF